VLESDRKNTDVPSYAGRLEFARPGTDQATLWTVSDGPPSTPGMDESARHPPRRMSAADMADVLVIISPRRFMHLALQAARKRYPRRRRRAVARNCIGVTTPATPTGRYDNQLGPPPFAVSKGNGSAHRLPFVLK
jgi:hypothetical protein